MARENRLLGLRPRFEYLLHTFLQTLNKSVEGQLKLTLLSILTIKYYFCNLLANRRIGTKSEYLLVYLKCKNFVISWCLVCFLVIHDHFPLRYEFDGISYSNLTFVYIKFYEYESSVYFYATIWV